jgi:predicted outer membrane repeat protein
MIYNQLLIYVRMKTMITNKWVAIMLILLMLPVTTIVRAEDAQNPENLISIIGDGNQSKSITLSSGFVIPSTVALPQLQSGVTIEIDGAGITLNKQGADSYHFKLSPNNAGTYVFQNIIFNGAGQAGGIEVGGNVKILNCLFKDNVGSAVVFPGGSATLEVDKSSFVNNYTQYQGGAIGASWGLGNNVNVKITNSYFKENRAGDSGGAIAFPSVSATYSQNGVSSIVIEQSVFEGNKALGADGNGGAICLRYFNPDRAATYSVTDCTFSDNFAISAASAILLEGYVTDVVGRGVRNLTGKVENCTFVKNATQSAGLGGAISVYAHASMDLIGNTFYQNSIDYVGTGAFAGAAFGVNGPQSTFFDVNSFGTANYMNNIFVDNKVNGQVNNIFVGIPDFFYYAINNGGNIDLDAAGALTVFGTATPALATNGSIRTAGFSLGSETSKPIQTLWIAPRISSDPNLNANFADGYGLTAMPQIALDQRGKARPIIGGQPVDAGAVDIASQLFDANGGTWNTLEESVYSYDYPVLYNAAKDTAFVAAGAIGDLSSPAEAKLSRTGYKLLGWDTNKNAAIPAFSYVDGTATNLPLLSGTPYYAIWELLLHIPEISSDLSLVVYPNPVVAGGTIQVKNEEWQTENKTIYLYSITGSLVKQASVTGKITEIQMNVAKGNYIVKVGSRKAKVIVN